MTDSNPAEDAEPRIEGPEPPIEGAARPAPRVQTPGGDRRQIPRALLILLGLAGGGVAIFTARELEPPSPESVR